MSVKTFGAITLVCALMLVIGGAGCVMIKPEATFAVIEKIKRFVQDRQSDSYVQKLQGNIESGKLK